MEFKLPTILFLEILKVSPTDNQWRRGDILLGTFKSHVSPTTMVVQQAYVLRQYTIFREKAKIVQIHQN